MKRRKSGRNGPKLSAVGLGCMGMSAFYGGRDGGESVGTLHRAVELGVTFFDSADAYANGANEELVRRELKPMRDRGFIATKFANTWGPDGKRTGISGKPDLWPVLPGQILLGACRHGRTPGSRIAAPAGQREKA